MMLVRMRPRRMPPRRPLNEPMRAAVGEVRWIWKKRFIR